MFLAVIAAAGVCNHRCICSIKRILNFEFSIEISTIFAMLFSILWLPGLGVARALLGIIAIISWCWKTVLKNDSRTLQPGRFFTPSKENEMSYWVLLLHSLFVNGNVWFLVLGSTKPKWSIIQVPPLKPPTQVIQNDKWIELGLRVWLGMSDFHWLNLEIV